VKLRILGKVRQRTFDHPLSCLVRTLWERHKAGPEVKDLKLGKAPGSQLAVKDPNQSQVERHQMLEGVESSWGPSASSGSEILMNPNSSSHTPYYSLASL